MSEEAKAALQRIRDLQQERLNWFRDKGVVFARAPLREAPKDEEERWEQIAFLIYTDLCEAESIAAGALEGWPVPQETLDPIPADYWETAQ